MQTHTNLRTTAKTKGTSLVQSLFPQYFMHIFIVYCHYELFCTAATVHCCARERALDVLFGTLQSGTHAQTYNLCVPTIRTGTGNIYSYNIAASPVHSIISHVRRVLERGKLLPHECPLCPLAPVVGYFTMFYLIKSLVCVCVCFSVSWGKRAGQS